MNALSKYVFERKICLKRGIGFLMAGGLLFPLPAIAQDTKPVVRDQVAPQVQEMNLSQSRVAAAPLWQPGDTLRVVSDLKESAEESSARVPDSTVVAGATLAPAAAPTTGVNFDGILATGLLPPDTVGDVGPNHYIQMVNSALAIYDKLGNQLVGPLPINALWSGFGGPCQTKNSGDPIVRYDHLADRWLVSQFAVPGGTQGNWECIAISRSPDPVSGGWFLYAFRTVDTATNADIFPDYPKIAVWPDAYYMGTQRSFPNGGLDVWAFEREQMLVGLPARRVQFAVPRPSLFLMPSDLDGPPPPAGTPNFFLRHVDGDRFGGNDRLEVFAFSVNWTNPAASTFTQIAMLPTAPFDSVLCAANLMGLCVPQPSTNVRLETLTVWTMWRLQYRNFGNYEAMVTNHTVDANGNDLAGIRWYELRRSPADAWSIFQQGTHAPDNVHRWMGSIAMDQDGNMALGYSVSSDTVFPGIRAATRLATDAVGTMPQTELALVNGGGSQTYALSPRWGNYSSMDVDPVDECTFWYTTEYYKATSAGGWRTHVSSFKHPSCGVKNGPERMRYQYAAKLVCGLQRDRNDMRIARGFYATAINIHNPNHKTAKFKKKLALTYPPEAQKPGKVIPIGKDELRYDEALEVDCMDIKRKLFPNGFPTPYIKGFVVIQSTNSLDVTAVYTTAALNKRGKVTGHSSIDVEQIPERKTRRKKRR